MSQKLVLTQSLITKVRLNPQNAKRSDLASYLSYKKVKGISKFSKDQLVSLINIIKTKKPQGVKQTKQQLITNKITAIKESSFLKNIKKQSEKKKEERKASNKKIEDIIHNIDAIREKQIISEKLRRMRKIKDNYGKISQNPIFDDYMLKTELNAHNGMPFKTSKTECDELVNEYIDKYAVELSNNTWFKSPLQPDGMYFIKRAYLALQGLDKVYVSMIKFLKLSIKFVKVNNKMKVRYVYTWSNITDIDIILKEQNPFAASEADDYQQIIFKTLDGDSASPDYEYIIGYVIQYAVDTPTTNSDIRKLKAYHPSCKKKYHLETTASTSNDKICIYETWLHIFVRSMINRQRESKNYQTYIYDSLHNEGEEIERSVKEGNLVESLELLTAKYNKQVLIKFFEEDTIIVINNGVIQETDNYDSFVGKECILYERTQNNGHVAPFLFKNNKSSLLESQASNIKKKERFFTLKPEIVKQVKEYELLTFSTIYDKDLNVTKISVLGSEREETFNNIQEFCEYLERISVPMNNRKTNAMHKIKKVILYGYENSKRENFQLYGELSNRFPGMKLLYSSGIIKQIKFNNIIIHDLSLFYKGLENDITKIFERAQEHFKVCNEKVNNRKTNLIKCSTVSQLALKTFTQCFLNEKIDQSPKEIFEKERDSYHGGRMEIFKKKFVGTNEEDKIYELDINSAHPYSMCQEMPFQYLFTRKFVKVIKDISELKKTNLYVADINYEGNNERYIPNIVGKNSEGLLAGVKNYYKKIVWGNELQQAFMDGCKITCYEENIYTPKVIFKGFVEHFYEKKSESNKGSINYDNAKSILNHPYGKFAQGICSSFEVVNNQQQLNKLLSREDIKLLSSEEISDVSEIFEYIDNKSEYTVGRLVRLASYISASTRCRLAEMMRDIGHDHIYYCNTDSIVTDKLPSEKYMDEKKLGFLKVEKTATEAYFVCTGINYLNCEEGMKFGNYEVDNDTIQQFKDITNGMDISIKKEREILRRSLKTGIKKETIMRTVQGIYNKRDFDNEGNSVAFLN